MISEQFFYKHALYFLYTKLEKNFQRGTTQGIFYKKKTKAMQKLNDNSLEPERIKKMYKPCLVENNLFLFLYLTIPIQN